MTTHITRDAPAGDPLLARNAVLPLDVVRDYFPAVTEQASTGPNATAIGNPVATRSVIYTSADGMEKVTLTVDQYRSPGEAAAAFQQAVETSREVPGFHPLPAPGIGQQSFAGTVTMGQETHIGMGALDGRLVVGVTLAGFDASPENQARLATLSAQEDAAARAALGVCHNGNLHHNTAVVMTHDDAYVVPQDHVLIAPAADSVRFNDDNATTATLASSPAHGSLQLAGNGGFSYTPAADFAGIDSFAYHAGNRSSTGLPHSDLTVGDASGNSESFRLIMPDHSGGLKFQVSDDGHGGTLLVGIAAADLTHLHHV